MSFSVNSVFLFFVISLILVARYAPILAASAPINCSSITYSPSQTLVFDATESFYSVWLNACKYNAGLVLTTLTPNVAPNIAARHNAVNLRLTNLLASSIQFDKSLVFAKGSSVIVESTTISAGGAFLIQMSMIDGQAIFNSLIVNAAINVRDGIYNNSRLVWNNVRAVSTSVAFQVSGITFTNSTLNATSFFLQATTVNTGYAFQWVASPVTNKSQLFWWNNTFDGAYAFHTTTATDWGTGTVATFSKNTFSGRATRNAVQLLLNNPQLLFDNLNVIKLGHLIVTHYGSSSNIRFTVAKSTMGAVTYTYSNALSTSTNDTVALMDSSFSGSVNIKLPTTSFSSVQLAGCSITGGLTTTYRSLNTGTITVERSTISAAVILNSAFLSYRLNATVADSTFGDCLTSNHSQIWYSVIALNRSTITCIKSEGLLTKSSYLIQGSGIRSSIHTPVANFANAWSDSVLEVVKSTIAGNAVGAGYRVVQITGEIQGATRHSFFDSVFASTATANDPAATKVTPAPKNCVVCYPKLSYKPTYNTITSQASVIFRRNQFTTAYSLSYFLYITVAEGGKLEFDGTNRATGLPAGTGQFYANFLSTQLFIPSTNSHLATAVQLYGPNKIVLGQFINTYGIDIRRAVPTTVTGANPISTGTSYQETFSVFNSSTKTIYIFIPDSISLTSEIVNVTATSKVSLIATTMSGATVTCRLLTTPTLYQSIGYLYTSTMDILNGKGALIQHYVTSLSGCTLSIKGNTLTSYIRLRGGLYDSYLTIEANNVRTASAYALWVDNYAMRASSVSVAKNVLVTTATGVATYSLFWSKSPVTVGTELLFDANNLQGRNCFYVADADFRSDTSIRLTRNAFTTTAKDFTLRFNVSGMQLYHDHTNRHANGRIYVYHFLHSKDNTFLLSGNASYKPASFQWTYYNTLYTSTNDIIRLSYVDLSEYITISWPTATNSVANVSVATATVVSIVYNRAAVGCKANVELSAATSIALYSVKECTNCVMSVFDSKITTFLQLSGTSYGTKHIAERTTMTSFKSSGLYNASTLRLFKVTVTGTASPIVTLDAAWYDATLDIDSSSFTTSTQKAIQISKHLDGSNSVYGGTTHQILNSNITVNSATLSTLKTVTPRNCGLCYIRTSLLPLGASILNNSNLIVKGTTFFAKYRDTYHIFANSIGGTITYDETNKANGDTVNKGRVYLQMQASSKGNVIVLNNHLNMYAIEVLRTAGTLGTDERIGLYNSTSGATVTINTANTQSLTLGFDNVGFTTTNIYGGDMRGAYIMLQRITGTRVNFAATNGYSITSNVSNCKLTAELYYSILSRDASLTTLRENTVSNPTANAGMRVRGGLVDSRMTLERNTVTRLTAQPSPYALWVDSFTVKSSVFSILRNNFTVPGLIVGGSMGIYWLASPIYTCSDVIVDGNNITGWHGFYMPQSDLSAGGTLWFRRNFIGGRNQSYFILRVNVTGGRLDFDLSNTIRWGSIMVTHMTSSKDNVLVLDGLATKAQIGSIDWQYQAPPGGVTTTYISKNDTIWLKDIQLHSYLYLSLPHTQNVVTNISGVMAASANIYSRSAVNWNVWVTNSKMTLSYLRIAVTTECSNCSFIISDTSILTYVLFQGRMIDSSQMVRRSTTKEVRSSGEQRNSSVSIVSSTISGSTAVALLVDATWEDSYFLIDSCVVTSTFYRTATFMKHVNGSSIHRFYNTTFFTTATALPPTVATRPTPSVCALCYVQAVGSTLRPSFNDRTSLIIQRTTFVSTSYILSYNLFVIMNGGRIDYDTSNRAFGTASYSGRYYIAFNRTSFANNTIAIANARFLNLIEVVKLAATSQVVSNGDTISVANSTTKAVWLSFCSVCNKLSLTLSNLTAISNTVNVNLPQIAAGSKVWVRRVSTPTFYILCPLFIGGSVLELDTSVISTIQFYVTLKGMATTATIRNNTLAIQIALTSNVGLLDGAGLHIVGNTITSVNAVPLWIQNMRIANNSLININSNVIRGSLALLTAKAYGLYWYNSPITDGSIALLVNNTISSYDYAAYFVLGEVASGGTLWLRTNTFASVLAAGYTLRVNVSGGRIDHDGSNSHRVGIAYVIHSARSKDNVFIFSTKVAIAGIYWVYTSTAIGVMSATNDTVAINDVNTVAMTGSVVITLPETNRSSFNVSRVKCVTVQFSCVKFSNSSVVVGQVVTTAYILLSVPQALSSDVGVVLSTVTTYISLANIVADSRSLVYVRSSTASYLLSTGTVKGGSSLLFQRLTLVGTAVPLLALDNFWERNSLLEVDQCTFQAASHRLIAISKQVNSFSTHRFTRNVITTTVTAVLAGSQPTPNVGGLAYLQPYGSTIPSYIYNQSGVSINKGNTFMCYVRDCYMVYITTNGGRLDIDNTNRYTGSKASIGRISINEVGNTTDSMVTISYATNLYYLHYRRLSGFGVNSSLYIANNTGIAYAEIRPLVCSGCSFHITNTTFVTTVILAATSLSNGSQIYFADVKAPTITHDLSAFVASRLEITRCTMTTYTHRVVASGGSTMLIKGNTVALMIEVRGGISSLLNPTSLAPQPVTTAQLVAANVSTLLIEGNTVTSATAHSALWFNSYPATNAAIRVSGNTLTSTSPIGKGLFWIGSVAANTTIVMEGNTMGSTWGLYFQTTDISVGSLLMLRRNIFNAKNATCYTVRLWPAAGGVVDHDGSNVHNTGIFELAVNKDAANNYIAVAASTFARFRWVAQATTLVTNNNTIILMGKVAISGGVDITTGICNNTRFMFANSSVTGATTIAVNTAYNTLIHFLDSTCAAVTISGSLRQNSSVLVQKARFTATVTLSATATDNARVVIANQSYFAPVASYGLLVSGQYLLNAQILIKDSNFNLVVAGIGIYVSAAVSNFSLVSTRIKTLSTATTNLCLQFTAAAVPAGAGIEIWNNTFVTGGVTIPLSTDAYFFYFIRNTGPLFTITNVVPAAASVYFNRTRRISSCNVNAANVAINATVANGIRVVWPCSGVMTIPRCLSSYDTPVNTINPVACDVLDVAARNPIVVGIVQPLAYYLQLGPRLAPLNITIPPMSPTSVPALIATNSLVAMNVYTKFTFDIFNAVTFRGDRALVAVDRSPVDFIVVSFSYPSVAVIFVMAVPLAKVPPPLVAYPSSLVFDIFTNMANVNAVSSSAVAKAPRQLFLTENAPLKQYVPQPVRSCMDPMPPPTTTTTILPTTTTTTVTTMTPTTATSSTTHRTTLIYTLPTVPITTAPDSASDSEDIDFSQLFPSNSLSEPTTTYLDTNEVPVPSDDEEPSDSNSGIGTVPPAFTAPTIPQEYFSSDSEDGEPSSIDYSNLPIIPDVTSYPSALPTDSPTATADPSLIPPTAAQSSGDFYYSDSDSQSDVFYSSNYDSGSSAASYSEVFSGSDGDDVPQMSSEPGEPSVGPPEEPPTDPPIPSEPSMPSYGEASNVSYSSETSSSSTSSSSSSSGGGSSPADPSFPSDTSSGPEPSNISSTSTANNASTSSQRLTSEPTEGQPTSSSFPASDTIVSGSSLTEATGANITVTDLPPTETSFSTIGTTNTTTTGATSMSPTETDDLPTSGTSPYVPSSSTTGTGIPSTSNAETDEQTSSANQSDQSQPTESSTDIPSTSSASTDLPSTETNEATTKAATTDAPTISTATSTTATSTSTATTIEPEATTETGATSELTYTTLSMSEVTLASDTTATSATTTTTQEETDYTSATMIDSSTSTTSIAPEPTTPITEASEETTFLTSTSEDITLSSSTNSSEDTRLSTAITEETTIDETSTDDGTTNLTSYEEPPSSTLTSTIAVEMPTNESASTDTPNDSSTTPTHTSSTQVSNTSTSSTAATTPSVPPTTNSTTLVPPTSTTPTTTRHIPRCGAIVMTIAHTNKSAENTGDQVSQRTIVRNSGEIDVEAVDIQRNGIPLNFTVSTETSSVGFFSNSSGHITVYVNSISAAHDAITTIGSFRHAFGSDGAALSCQVTEVAEAQVASCYLSAMASYAPTSSERLQVYVPRSAFAKDCSEGQPSALRRVFEVQDGGTSNVEHAFVGYLLVAPYAENAYSAPAEVATTVMASASALASLVLGAAAFDVYALAALLGSSCASVDENAMVDSLMYIVAPLRGVAKGASDADANREGHVGMALGNVAIIALIAAVQFATAKLFVCSRRLSMLEAMAAVFFPSVSYIVADLLYTGAAIGSFSLIRKGIEGGSGKLAGSEVFAILAGVAAVVIVPLAVIYTIIKVANPRFHKYTQFLSRPWYRRVFFPQSFIRPEVQLRAFGRHVRPFANGSKSVQGVFAMPVICVICFVLYLLPDSVPCNTRFYICFAIFVILAAYLAAARPYRFGAQTILLAISSLLLAAISIVMARQAETNTADLANTHIALVYLLIVSVLARTLFMIAVFYLEHAHWRHFQEQSLRDWFDDANEDDASHILSSGGDVVQEDDTEGWNALLMPKKESVFSKILIDEGDATGEADNQGDEMRTNPNLLAKTQPRQQAAAPRTMSPGSTSSTDSDFDAVIQNHSSDQNNDDTNDFSDHSSESALDLLSSDSDTLRSSPTASNTPKSKESVIQYNSSSMSSDEDFL